MGVEVIVLELVAVLVLAVVLSGGDASSSTGRNDGRVGVVVAASAVVLVGG